MYTQIARIPLKALFVKLADSGHQARAGLEGLHGDGQRKGNHGHAAVDDLSFLRRTMLSTQPN